MSVYERDDSYGNTSYQGYGYRPSGAGILAILAAVIALGLGLIIGLSFIYGSSYDSMRGGNDADTARELPLVNQPRASEATPYLPDARSPDLGTNNGQPAAPASP